MDISTMHIYWREKLDKSGSLSSADFESEQIDFWLNEAIRKFVKDRYAPEGKGFEQTEKRTADLENIVESATLSCSASTIKPNSYVADLTSLTNHWFTVGEEVAISYTDCHGEKQSDVRQGVTQCTEDTYRPMIDNAFSEHLLDKGRAKPLRLRRQKDVVLVSDGSYDVDYYYITYIRQPAEVNYDTGVDCDLATHTHDEIIDISVRMVTASLGDVQKYQLESVEDNKHID